MATETSDGPTPAGGVRSTLTYLDAAGNETDKATATGAIGIEYDADGNQLRRTYLTVPAAQGPQPDVFLAAILEAEAQGDTATADELRAIAADPDRAAQVLNRLQVAG